MIETSEIHVVLGTGQLGTTVVHELLRQGKRVRAVNRQGKATFPQNVEVVKGDVTDPVSVRNACLNAKVVYHCVNAPYTEWANKLPPIMTGIIDGVSAVGAKLVYLNGARGLPLQSQDLTGDELRPR
ncbi:MAG: NAD(P)H-binding protein [Nodularia sp. CChRGM 3473]